MINNIRTRQLINAVILGVCARSPETGSLVCVRAEKNWHFGYFALLIADLGILGYE